MQVMERENRIKRIDIFFYLTILFILIFNTTPVGAEPLELIIHKGNKNYNAKNYEEALKYYLQAEKKSGKNYRATYNKANTLYRLENYTEAEKSYIEALNTKKDRIKKNAYFNLGNTYFLLGEYKKAIDSYIKALEIDPYDMDAKYNLELAWKKLKEQEKKQSRKNQLDKSKNEDEKKEKTKQEKEKQEKNKEETTASKKQQSNNELQKMTPQEAEKIINSVENNQDKILRETLLQKVNPEDEEKDW